MSDDDRIFCPFCMDELKKADTYVDEKTKEVVVVGYCDSCNSKCELDRIKDPDFANLLGYDSEKLLPFSFKKLTEEEIIHQMELGLIEDETKLKPALRYSANQDLINKLRMVRM